VRGAGRTTNTVNNACAAKDNSMLSHSFPTRNQHTQKANINTSDTAHAELGMRERQAKGKANFEAGSQVKLDIANVFSRP
jgi:hypothetical protein